MVTRKDVQWACFKIKFQPLAWAVFLFLAALCWFGSQTALAADEAPSWRRIRTNSIPHQPANLTVDATGSVWVTAVEDTEYDTGVWRLPLGDTSARFQYLTDSRTNNYLLGIYNNVVEKPQLEGDVRFAIQDNDGNAWYALNNRNVLCEKADGSWLTIAMENTQTGFADTANVDSAHRIRLMGTQGRILISGRGIKRIDSDFTVAETRGARSEYNNDYIYDALIDSRGRYWVASGRGVEYGSTIFNTYFVSLTDVYKDDPEVPPYETPITGIMEDSQGNLWFINSAYGATGIYCLTAPTQDKIHGDWLKFNVSALLTGARNQVTCMAAGTNGTMWFGPLASGLVKYTPGAATPWTRTPCASLGLQSESLVSMEEAGGKLWFVTDYEPSVQGNGTGVHALTLADSSVVSYTYRKSSTSLTSNRITSMAGDRSGGVWFAAYDDPSVSRMKVDGTWTQYRTDKMDLPWALGTGSISGIGVDSRNIVYMAPNRRAPMAYDISTEQWLTLPAGPSADTYFYNLYVDPRDGKWFCGSRFVFHLNSDNSAWEIYDTTDITKFPDYRIQYALMDGEANMWFMTTFISPPKVSLMKKDPGGSAPSWHVFIYGDASGYLGGPRLYLDTDGNVWNSASQRFDSASNKWMTQADTTPFDKRPMHFLNGGIPVKINLLGSLGPITDTDQDRMTVDKAGNVYFSSSLLGLASVNAGIVVAGPVKGDINRDLIIELSDAVLSEGSLVGKASGLQSHSVDVTGNGRVDMAETLYVLQKLTGLR